MAVLTSDDLRFWKNNGYVVVSRAVPPSHLKAVIEDIWWFLEMDADEPETWYRPPHRPGGMIEMYQTQALWDNRQAPRVHQAFAEIWGTEKLWVSMDRVNMKPPTRPDKPDWDHPGMIHWDMDTDGLVEIPFRVQGVLYLSDTAKNQGGFQCVPGFHNRFLEWVKTQPADRDPRHPDLTGLEVKSIPGKAGDLLIWHSLLPHGNGRNTSHLPRLAQYISMSPCQPPSVEACESRVAMWRERSHPVGTAFPGDDRQKERDRPSAELSDLGRKLLGVDSW